MGKISFCSLALVLRAPVIFFCFLGTSAGAFASEETVCAVVKIEILQELTLERQGFEAKMRITNALDTLPLENVNVEVLFKDANGDPVIATTDPNGDPSAKFFFRIDDLVGVDNVDGTGTIPPKTTADATWLIVPTAGAAEGYPDGVLYFVGAKLTYNVGGKAEEVIVADDNIVVKPLPKLTLDYFLTRDIFGDDAFTPDVIEPPIPYTLGVRISNNGTGPAPSVRIDSAQPKIVENDQGLAIGFKILGSYVGNTPAEPTLLIDFGEIAPNGMQSGRWIMETTLSGRFIDFDAEVSHADALGGQLTSLIEGANTHFLLRDVFVDLPGRDQVRDFLAINAAGLSVYESERNGSNTPSCTDCMPVNDVSETTHLGAESASDEGFVHTLSLPASSMPVYTKVVDPHEGRLAVRRLLRSDGKVMNSANVWLSQERSADPAIFNHYLSVFDISTTGEYIIEFADGQAGPQPPTIQFIPARTTYEGGQLGFIVVASDPNGDPISLNVEQLPQGASFTDKGSGQGVFSWFPQVGQAGIYKVDFIAADGIGETRQTVQITVHREGDRDGDGMDDAWELEHFGNLDRDGSGDFDGDGFSDLEEFNNNTNPKVIEAVPEVPVLMLPVDGSEVSELPFQFVIDTDNQPDSQLVTLSVEIYADAELTDLVGVLTDIAIEKPSLAVEADELLQDQPQFLENGRYYWRARAEAPTGASEWELASFIVNTVNEAPTGLRLDSPSAAEMIGVLSPEFLFRNATDVDGDAVQYDLFVFAENEPEVPVIALTGIEGDLSGVTLVSPSQSLQEDRGYVWHVVARDEHGLEAKSEPQPFFISTQNHPPVAPQLLLPSDASEVAMLIPTLAASRVSDPERDLVTYQLQVATSKQFSPESVVYSSDSPDEVGLAVEWQVDALDDNREYFWRVRATDGVAHSPWSDASFFVNTANDPPSRPVIVNPGDDAWVEVVQPQLRLASSIDVDRDALVYEFRLFSDESGETVVTAGSSVLPEWTIDVPLGDNRHFYWTARAVDEHGAASTWTDILRFFVNKDGYDDPPTFEFLLPSENVYTLGGDVHIQWRDTDPDSDAVISLYANGIPLSAEPIFEDRDGEADTYRWNLSEIPPGTYFLSASISDDTSSVDAFACCAVEVLPTIVGFVVEKVSGIATEETGTDIVEFSVRPDAMPLPGTSVAVNFSVDGDEARILNASKHFVFDWQNWQTPRTIRVAGLDDCEADGDESVNLNFSAASSNDNRFDGVFPPAQRFTNTDNEMSEQTLFICEYETVDSLIMNNGRVRLSLRAKLRNTGAPRQNITAAGQIVSGAQTTLGAEHLEFPDAFTHSSVLSEQAFTLDVPGEQVPDFAKLVWDIQPGAEIPFVTGGDGRDNLRGGRDGDYLSGGGGNDLMRGGDGDDVLHGGAGSDQYFGDKGNDTFLITGDEPGVDSFNGGNGYDRVLGSDLDDRIVMTRFVGANRVEEIDGGAGINVISGTEGNDSFDFSDTSLLNISHIELHGGDDRLIGSDGADVIIGGAGNDELRGRSGDDVFLFAGIDNGIDQVEGGDGSDAILGSDGDDLIKLQRFESPLLVESIDGRGGNDVLAIADGGSVLNLAGVAIRHIELLRGGSGDDVITGSSGDDVVAPGQGFDRVYLGSGNDRLLLDSTSGAGQYWGGDGYDTIVGGIEDDVIILMELNPVHSFERIDGDGGFNVLAGTANSDQLDFSATELVSIDRISLGDGNDRLTGSSSIDWIDGGSGDDWLDGFHGGDVYLFTRETGSDVIEDTGPEGEADSIWISGGVTPDVIWIFPISNGWELRISGSESGIIIRNKSIEELLLDDGRRLVLNGAGELVDFMSANREVFDGTRSLSATDEARLTELLARYWVSGSE